MNDCVKILIYMFSEVKSDIQQYRGPVSEQSLSFCHKMSNKNWKASVDRGLRDCKMNAELSNKVALFNQVADNHKEKQMINPFSSWDGASHRRKLDKSDASYGKPIEGSHTERRGRDAQASVTNEVRTLCEIIQDCGALDKDSTSRITFGELFQMYNVISGNVVGILLRARKKGFVDFPGETLFQRRDDNVAIHLMKPLEEIKEILAGRPPNGSS